MEGLGAIRGVQMFSVGVLSAFAVLHFVLYRQHRASRVNLLFGFTLLVAAAATFLDFQSSLLGGALETSVLRVHRVLMSTFFLLLFITVFRLFGRPLPNYMGWLVGISVASALAGGIAPRRGLFVMYLAMSVFNVLIAVATWRSYRSGGPNARIIAWGLLFLLVSFSYDVALDILDGLGALDVDIATVFSNAYPFGIMALLIATSTALARTTATTERRLGESEVERRFADAERLRQERELQDARLLQQSFLPDATPDVSGFDLAFFQRTATEVGGDYYDFTQDDNLTVVVGDATGHGTRAGLMVAVAKSLFHTIRGDQEIGAFLSESSRIVKDMKLGNMFMGLAVARLDAGHVTYASAGMPPAMLRRADGGPVERLTHKTMPLGAVKNYVYESQRHRLAPGDTLLIASDGLMECFDDSRNELGLDRIEELFSNSVAPTAAGLVAELFELADSWRGRVELADDVTVAVIRRSRA